MDGEKQTNKALQPVWHIADQTDSKQKPNPPKIAVIGIGKTGNEATTGIEQEKAYTIAINNNPIELDLAQADKKILISWKPSNRHVCWRSKAEEALEQLCNQTDFDAVFITTVLDEIGTRIAPIAAETTKKKDALTIGVVAVFPPERKRRANSALQALKKLEKLCTMVVVVDSKKLIEAAPQLQFEEIRRITAESLVTIIKNMMETLSTHPYAEPIGLNHVDEAMCTALKTSPLNVDYKARGALIHVTSDSQMLMEEADHLRGAMAEMMHSDAHVIWDARVEPQLDGRIKVTLIMTKLDTLQKSCFDSIAPQLFNMEPFSEPEKKLPLHFGLYQLENVET